MKQNLKWENLNKYGWREDVSEFIKIINEQDLLH